VFPDFRKTPSTPDVKDWVMIGYDTNASGKPISVHQVSRADGGPEALNEHVVASV
jgi:hypothetical protein